MGFFSCNDPKAPHNKEIGGAASLTLYMTTIYCIHEVYSSEEWVGRDTVMEMW